MVSEIFVTIPDHRVTGRCRYKPCDLLGTVLLTFMCKGVDYVDMSCFAATRAREYGMFEGCETSPSPDTFERLMSSVDPEEVERCLREYGRQLVADLSGKQIAIDGKKLRGTNPRLTGNRGLYLMNAFVTENEILIAQEKINDKENEIVAIPRVLDKLDLTDATVSIDAIGTQVDIAQKIVEGGGHYFLAVKENQPLLYENVVGAFRCNRPKNESEESDAGHGRVETRRCAIMDATNMIDPEVVERWPGLKTIVRIESDVTCKADSTDTCTTRYYISDEAFPRAAYYNMLARGHWKIENNLHWHLDVTFGEDACRARKKYAPQNLSLIRKMALQGIKSYDDKRRSVRKRMFQALLQKDYLDELIKSCQF